jgi:hypothetical protein
MAAPDSAVPAGGPDTGDTGRPVPPTPTAPGDAAPSPQKHFGSEARLVLLGVAASIVPLLIGHYIQARAEAREKRIDRRLAALREYSAGCAKLHAAWVRMFDANEYEIREQARTAAERKEPDSMAAARVPSDRYRDTWNDLYAALAERAVQRDIVRATFEFDARSEMPNIPETPGTMPGDRMRLAVQALEKECNDTARILAARVAE